MSQFSGVSNQSVSFRGDNDVSLENALDTCFKDLQDTLNSTHYNVRMLGMEEDQSNDYNTRVDLFLQIIAYFDDLTELNKELKSICQEVLGKPETKEEKEYFKTETEKYKKKKADEKQKEKDEKKQNKESLKVVKE